MERMTDHLKWIKGLAGDASGRAIANRSQISVATVNRQINKGVFTAEVVIAIARGYGESPVKALVATGYITAKEAIGINETSVAQLLTDRQLIRELARRVDSKGDIWEENFDSVVQSNTPSRNDVANELKPEPKPDVSTEVDHDAIIEQINAGKVKFAAQKHTPPLEENTP